MGRLRGFLWLIAGIVVAALAGAVAYITLTNVTTRQLTQSNIVSPERSVIVAINTIERRGALSTADVEIRKMPVDDIPEGALESMDQVVGKITLVELYPGEVLLEQRLLDPNIESGDGRMALVMSEEQVLMAFPAADLLNRTGILKAGDHVDFLFSYELPTDRDTGFLPGVRTTAPEDEEGEETELVTFDLMQNVSIAAVVAETTEDGRGDPEALLLVINPQDALVLKYMKDVGAVVDLVLRAPEAEGEFQVEPVDLDYIINGFIIPGESAP